MRHLMHNGRSVEVIPAGLPLGLSQNPENALHTMCFVPIFHTEFEPDPAFPSNTKRSRIMQ